MSLAQIRTAVMNALATVPGLRTYDYEDDMPAPPAAVVRMPLGPQNPRAYLGGGWDYEVTIDLLVSRSDDRGGDGTLEAFLAESGSGSVVAALRTDSTLGGACQSADVVDIGPVNIIPVGSLPTYSCSIVLEVLT
jgi:hypothetical protein